MVRKLNLGGDRVFLQGFDPNSILPRTEVCSLKMVSEYYKTVIQIQLTCSSIFSISFCLSHSVIASMLLPCNLEFNILQSLGPCTIASSSSSESGFSGLVRLEDTEESEVKLGALFLPFLIAAALGGGVWPGEMVSISSRVSKIIEPLC